jgi:hypothetical protein
MLLRREFLAGIVGWLTTGGKAKGTPVHKGECPTESVQQLIQQIRFLEQDPRSKEHVQAIQDQIRSRLLLTGLACVFLDTDGQYYVCALETQTGCLWCVPLNQSDQPWVCDEWEKIGLSGLENQIRTLPRACDI